MSRSMHVNGLSKEVAVENFVPWWQPAMLGANVAVGILTLGSLAMYAASRITEKKREKEGN